MSPNFASAAYFVGTFPVFGMGTLENLKDQGTPPGDNLHYFPSCVHLFSSLLSLILKLAYYQGV